jgi:hypothetical protein
MGRNDNDARMDCPIKRGSGDLRRSRLRLSLERWHKFRVHRTAPRRAAPRYTDF